MTTEQLIDLIRRGNRAPCVHHFTDTRNISSIATHGILSRTEITRRNFCDVTFGGNQWSFDQDDRRGNLPHHAFYDWLFLKALKPYEMYLSQRLQDFDAFSDIEFNPERSINTQARSIAIIKCLILRGQIGSCADDFDFFRSMMFEIERKTSTQIQLGFAE